MIKILQNKFKENIWRFKKDQEVDNNFKKEFKKFKKWKIKKIKINKESVKISSWTMWYIRSESLWIIKIICLINFKTFYEN